MPHTWFRFRVGMSSFSAVSTVSIPRIVFQSRHRQYIRHTSLEYLYLTIRSRCGHIVIIISIALSTVYTFHTYSRCPSSIRLNSHIAILHVPRFLSVLGIRKRRRAGVFRVSHTVLVSGRTLSFSCVGTSLSLMSPLQSMT